MDLFTVQTITLRTLYAIVFIAHDRLRVVHVNVTQHPTAEWVWRQRSLTRFSGQFTCRHHAASAAAAGLLSYSTGLRSPIEV